MLPPWGDGVITDWVTELVEYQNASTPDHQPVSINSWIEGILGDPGAVSRARRKVTRKVFKHGWKSPWVPTLTRPFPKGQANASSWLDTKKLCIISPNRWTVSPEFFLWVRTRRLLSCHGCLVRSPSFPNYWWVEERFGCYQREQFNLHWENSVSDGSQCIVNNRKFKMQQQLES